MSTVTVGLTGGIASGKSTVSRMFADLGAHIIDFDILAREVVQIGKPALKELVDIFLQNILDAKGELDRAKLRQMMFSNPSVKTQIEQIMHPKIEALYLQRLAHIKEGLVIAVAPLLLEKGWLDRFDHCVIVDVMPDVQMKRLLARDDMTKKLAESIIAQQIDRADRFRFVQHDKVVLLENMASIDELQSKVKALYQQFAVQ